MAFSSSKNPRRCHQKTAVSDGEEQSTLLHCAHLILPWLTPSELANAALTCKTLSHISKSITRSRSLDASRSLENLPVPFHNTVDDIPHAYFIYTPSQLIASSVSHFLQRQCWGPTQPGPHSVVQSDPGKNSEELAPIVEESLKLNRNGVESVRLVDECGESVYGCDCEKCLEGGSDENELFGCPCFSGLEEVGMASECGPSCGCGLECENRLTQRGISVRLKIVRDVKKGWGLYAHQLIRQGQFICEYAGELLTTKEARRRQQIYDELASRRGISSALLVIREHLPSGKACLRMNIDATRVGNIARFINHSCDGGNLSTILVRSSGALLPCLCFFASKDIKEGEELTFSYGEIRVKSKGLTCFCGSSSCFGILPSEHT